METESACRMAVVSALKSYRMSACSSPSSYPRCTKPWISHSNLSACNEPTTAPSVLRPACRDNSGMTQPGTDLKCPNPCKSPKGAANEKTQTAITFTPTTRRQDIEDTKCFHYTNGDTKDSTTHRPVNTDKFVPKSKPTLTEQNKSSDHNTSSTNNKIKNSFVHVESLNETDHNKTNSNEEIKNTKNILEMKNKLIEKGENCEVRCKLDSNHSDGSYPDESNSRSDDNGVFTGDNAENYDSESCSPLSELELSPFVEEDSSTVESTPYLVVNQKQRGKRKCYTWGGHKLVKPIKNIPARFQVLLAENSAARVRYEGQPIYMSHQNDPTGLENNSLAYTQNDNSYPLNSVCVSENEPRSGETNLDFVSYSQAPAYANINVTSSDGTTYCDSWPTSTAATPVYDINQSSPSQSIPHLFVYAPTTTSSNFINSQCVPNQSIILVSMPWSGYPPAPTLPPPHPSQSNPGSYIHPYVNQPSPTTLSQPAMPCPGDQPHYPIITTNKWPTLKQESPDPTHNSPTNHIPYPPPAIPPVSNYPFSKCSSSTYAPFSQFSVPPPNFPILHMIG